MFIEQTQKLKKFNDLLSYLDQDPEPGKKLGPRIWIRIRNSVTKLQRDIRFFFSHPLPWFPDCSAKPTLHRIEEI